MVEGLGPIVPPRRKRKVSDIASQLQPRLLDLALEKERGGALGSVNSQQGKSALSMTWRHKAAIALAGRRKYWSVWVVLF